jgi:hypothetical protein
MHRPCNPGRWGGATFARAFENKCKCATCNSHNPNALDKCNACDVPRPGGSGGGGGGGSGGGTASTRYYDDDNGTRYQQYFSHWAQWFFVSWCRVGGRLHPKRNEYGNVVVVVVKCSGSDGRVCLWCGTSCCCCCCYYYYHYYYH